jgi:hypothetical protein
MKTPKHRWDTARGTFYIKDLLLCNYHVWAVGQAVLTGHAFRLYGSRTHLTETP